MGVDTVDALLERYLALLDEYTRLRDQLNGLQGAMYQQLARANFAAERGIRYGQDFYDDRMQAVRRIEVEGSGLVSGTSAPVFRAVAQEDARPEPRAEDEGPKTGPGKDPGPPGAAEQNALPKTKDPLRWFGILTPMPLRQAQSQAVEAVEQVIPKLVSVNAEMLGVEIEVRRARKKRAKAEGAEKKLEPKQEPHREVAA